MLAHSNSTTVEAISAFSAACLPAVGHVFTWRCLTGHRSVGTVVNAATVGMPNMTMLSICDTHVPDGGVWVVVMSARAARTAACSADMMRRDRSRESAASPARTVRAR